MTSAVVLLSGGQDSTTCLFWAKQRYNPVHTLTIAYGQRHAAEVTAAAEIAWRAKPQSHQCLRLGILAQLGDSALVDKKTELRSTGGYQDTEALDGLPTSFVPGRNAFFLATAVSHAVKIGVKTIVIGVCQTDYSGYPDCRRAFIDAMETAMTLAMPSSCGPISIVTPLMYLNKADTVRMARTLGDDCWKALGMSQTCYHGTRCGTCPACELRAQGFTDAGERDPAA